MKKILFLSLAALGLMTIVSCSDDDYAKRYENPSKTSTVGVPQVFTGVLQAGNAWMNPCYYRYYTQSPSEGMFAGIIGTQNGRGRYRGAGEGCFNTHWKDFYNQVTQFRLLEENYNNLPEDQQTANKVFYLLGRTVTEAQVHEMLSTFGDIPFTGAGMLWKTGDYAAAKAAVSYDDDVEIYKTILTDLKEVGDFFANEGVDGNIQKALSRQDFTAANGNIDIWQRYVNSLRLRVALHLATNGDLTSVAQAAIKEILENPTKYPVIETNDQNQGVNGDTQTDNFNYGKSIAQALAGRSEGSGSKAMLDAMNVPANGIPDANTDPRLSAIYDCNPDGEYIAYDNSLTESEISNIADEKNKEYLNRSDNKMIANYYCYIDSIAFAGHATYQGNANLNGIWIGAAEVELSKAEAYLMGYGVGKNDAAAKTHFVKGVILSNEYFWNMKLNSSLTNYVNPVEQKDEEGKTMKDEDGNTIYESYGYFNDSYKGDRPVLYEANLVASDAAGAKEALLAYVGECSSAYAEKIWNASQNVVATQLWLNFCFMNETEAWNVVRRTGFPTVKFAKDTYEASYPTPPDRLPYPSDESNYNKDNYDAAVAINYKDKTGYYGKLFWAKENYFSLY